MKRQGLIIVIGFLAALILGTINSYIDFGFPIGRYLLFATIGFIVFAAVYNKWFRK